MDAIEICAEDWGIEVRVTTRVVELEVAHHKEVSPETGEQAGAMKDIEGSIEKVK